MNIKMAPGAGLASRPEPAIDAAFSDSARPSEHIDRLLHRNPKLWRGCDLAGQGGHGQSTGFAALDDILPGRGWPQSGLLEIITPQWGMGELQLLMPLMREVIEQGKWILWVSPPYQLYAPALVQAGIDTRQVLVVKADTACSDALWSMEKALQAQNCGLVLAWQNWLPGRVLRRLQLAGDSGNTLGVLFKHNDSKYSPSSMRLKINGLAHENRAFPDTEVTLIKARGNFRPLSTRLNLYARPQTN